MSCPVCQHPKCEAINAALAVGLASAVIAVRFRLAKPLIENHERTCRLSVPVPSLFQPIARDEALLESSEDSNTPEARLRRFREHVQAAAMLYHQDYEDRQRRERMQWIVQEAFQAEEMGL